MSKEIKPQAGCFLYWSMQRDRVRMTADCMRTGVKIGTERCDNYLGETNGNFTNPKNISNICNRAILCRNIGGRE